MPRLPPWILPLDPQSHFFSLERYVFFFMFLSLLMSPSSLHICREISLPPLAQKIIGVFSFPPPPPAPQGVFFLAIQIGDAFLPKDVGDGVTFRHAPFWSNRRSALSRCDSLFPPPPLLPPPPHPPLSSLSFAFSRRGMLPRIRRFVA